MVEFNMKELLEAGVHFGHRTGRWNPKMRTYIFTERNGIHIIDLQQTVGLLEIACNKVKEVASGGGVVLFVGTKKQAQESIAQAASGCSMPYVNARWLGGTLTNFRTIRQRIDYLLGLQARYERGDFEGLSKKETLGLQREIARLEERFGGIREMRRLPDMVFVVDVRRESIAVNEAKRLQIPIVAMVDTNCDPDLIDYVIPSNDDAIRAIRFVSAKIGEAIQEGRQIWEAVQAEEGLKEVPEHLWAMAEARANASPESGGEELKEGEVKEEEVEEGAPAKEKDKEEE